MVAGVEAVGTFRALPLRTAMADEICVDRLHWSERLEESLQKHLIQ